MIPLDQIPTPKSERWKYTNLLRALKGLSLSPATLGWGANNVALLRGDAPGVSVYRDTALWDLNTAQSQDVKIVTANETINVAAIDGQHLSPRIIVQVADGADVTLIERQSGAGGYFKNQVVQISVGKNARLRHYRFIDEAERGVNATFTYATVQRDARYEAFTLIEGAGMVRNQIHVDVVGENAHCVLGGINFLRGDQHADTTITIEHQAPHCSSNQTYKSVLDGRAHGVFQGKVHVHQAAQKTDGYQLSNALILSPEAEMDTKPELEIYADDVKCSHGATTGKLDETALFYLRARGIPESSARSLLIGAFCNDALSVVSDDDVRGILEERIAAWLAIKA